MPFPRAGARISQLRGLVRPSVSLDLVVFGSWPRVAHVSADFLGRLTYVTADAFGGLTRLSADRLGGVGSIAAGLLGGGGGAFADVSRRRSDLVRSLGGSVGCPLGDALGGRVGRAVASSTMR